MIEMARGIYIQEAFRNQLTGLTGGLNIGG